VATVIKCNFGTTRSAACRAVSLQHILLMVECSTCRIVSDIGAGSDVGVRCRTRVCVAHNALAAVWRKCARSCDDGPWGLTCVEPNTLAMCSVTSVNHLLLEAVTFCRLFSVNNRLLPKASFLPRDASCKMLNMLDNRVRPSSVSCLQDYITHVLRQSD